MAHGVSQAKWPYSPAFNLVVALKGQEAQKLTADLKTTLAADL